MAETIDTLRAQAELQKIELEIKKLTLDVASATRVAGLDLTLRLLPSITVMVTVLGFGFTVWQYRAEQNNARYVNEQQSKKDAEERSEKSKKEAEVAQREFMKPLLQKQQEFYLEAATVAATIASSHDAGERRKAEARFWVLYWGPLVMVESEDVSGAMKNFGYCLNGTMTCTPEVLKKRSLVLASTLELSMLKTWNAKPEEFTKGQFIYR